jgi:tripartite motif-containing protein 71
MNARLVSLVSLAASLLIAATLTGCAVSQSGPTTPGPSSLPASPGAHPSPSMTNGSTAVALDVVWELSDGIGQPTGLGLAADGSVLVVDFAKNVIHHVSPDGHAIEDWSSGGSAPGQLAAAAGLAVADDGSIYVADHNNYRIERFDGDGRFLAAWGTRGNGKGQLDGPDGVAIGPDGLVYVSEDTNARIQVFDTTGAWKRFITGSHDEPFGDPTGMAFHGATTFVADFLANRIWTLDADGRVVGSIGEGGSGDGQFRGLSMLATDAPGDLYATDYDNGRIQRFDSAGKHLATYVLPNDARFRRPFGIAVGSDGDLYVAEFQAGRVSRLRVP